MNPDNSTDQGPESRHPRYILEIIGSAFDPAPELHYHTLFLFPVIEKAGDRWGFLIITRLADDNRLELAAYSYESDEQGGLSKKLESRKALLPEEKLDQVLEGLIERMDELDSNYREISLHGLASSQDQLEYLEKILSGETDAIQTGQPGQLQPGESAEHQPQPGDSGSQP